MTKTVETENQYKKGLWTVEEDKILMDYVKVNGKGQWNRIAKKTSLNRCGKSCRLRWMNYLCPNVNRGNFTEEEEDLIIRLHKLLGNRWSLIAKRVPGRTDNQVKNYWNTHLSKKLGIKHHSRRRVTLTQTPSSSNSEVSTNTDTQKKAITNNVSADTQEQESTTTTVEEEEEGFVNSLWISDDEFNLGNLSTMFSFTDDIYF